MNSHIQEYTCEHGEIARIIIPETATKTDLEGIKDMLDVVIIRHFKHISGKEHND